ncbi:MAG: hypothetical protein V4492_05490 [Chlamydiota bacterium]
MSVAKTQISMVSKPLPSPPLAEAIALSREAIVCKVFEIALNEIQSLTPIDGPRLCVAPMLEDAMYALRSVDAMDSDLAFECFYTTAYLMKYHGETSNNAYALSQMVFSAVVRINEQIGNEYPECCDCSLA